MPVSAWLPIRATDKISRRRIIATAEALLVVGAFWLVGPRIALDVAGTVSGALLLVICFWFVAFGMKLGLFVAVSWDDFPDLLLASFRASAPAMWLAPATLLLSTRSTAAAFGGLLLVANTTRLLIARNAPQKLTPPPAPAWTRRYRMFRDEATPRLSWSRGIFLPVAGAIALQVGLFGIWTAHAFAAAFLIATGAALWSWSALAKGFTDPQDESRPSHSLVGILLTLLVTWGLSYAQLRQELTRTGVSNNPPRLLDTMRFIWQELEHPIPSQPAPRPSNTAHLVNPQTRATAKATLQKTIAAGGRTLVPGVIVRAAVQPRRQLLFFVRRNRSGSTGAELLDRELTIPFTGEYQVFPTSSAGLEHDWAEERGTLLENAYITAGTGSLETEALQKFDPPIDFAQCGKVRIGITSQEQGPFAASMQLHAGREVVELGLQMAGFDRHDEESLDFTVPVIAHTGPVTAIRVAFHQIPRQGRQSMKVVIRRFTLEPR